WDDLWLNESFANMMEYEAVNAIFPEWEVWDSFINHEGLSALRRDATPGVQSVKQAVNHPDEISTLFDHSIVYAKGGRLLYMLKNYVGEDAFRKGLTDYFKRHSYKNTSGSDLWDALSEASGSDVGAFMDPWLTRSGFPVIKVRQKGKELALRQEHFLDNPEKSDPGRVWPVPLFASDKNVPKLLTRKDTSCVLSSDEYVRVNQGALGHYIVDYDSPRHREAIIGLLRQGKLDNPERLMLLNDASMLARAGYQCYGSVLKMLEAYSDETSESVWEMISLIIGETRRFIDLDEGLEAKIKRLVRGLVATEYKRLGWTEKTGEPAADTKLRATIVGLGTYAEDPEIISKGKKLFEAYRKDPSSVATELR
ncbi:MAG: M1 family metallopeptidase, partial [Candidatus Saccharimonadales bacterium]